MTRRFKLLLFISFIILVAMNCYIGYGYTPSSDQASGVIISHDIANGNILLSGWFLSTVTFYFTDLIWYALLDIIGISNKVQSYLVPSILISALTICCIILSYHKKKLPWAIFFSFGILGAYSSNIFNLAVSHIGAYLYTAIIYIIIERTTVYKANIHHYLIVFLLSLAIFFSDDISKYAFLIPLISSLAIELFYKRNKVHLHYAASIFLAFILSKTLLYYVQEIGGFQLPGIGYPKFATQEEFINNLYFLCVGLLRLFEAYFFGMDIGLQSFSSIIRLCFLLFFVYIIASNARKITRFSTIDRALLLTAIIMPCAFLFSNIPSAVESIRYIAPSVIFGAVFICRNVNISQKTSLFLLSLSFVSGAIIYGNAISLDKKNHEINDISKYIKEHNLKAGFASFWFASSVSLNSGSEISPVVFNNHEGSVKPFLWLAKINNYEQNNSFIIADSKEDMDAAIMQYGRPDVIDKVMSKFILVWNDGINIPFTGFHTLTNSKYFGSLGYSDEFQVCKKDGATFLVTGPYKPLKKGMYKMHIEKSGRGDVLGDIVAFGGKKLIAKINNVVDMDFYIDKTYPDVEVRIYNSDTSSCISSISIEMK
ncbi:putative membrane protein [Escherichia coli 1-110-08_S3_C1]|uniref:hypothetical protein n=1 Tax=Escherichia coli TaxID=562 RepID=UPI000451C825|nr:hypothetical protein [Escherichia coli]EIP6817343.1 hypothetical protein [Escherichia coli]EYE14388.1 putative membrane protein [Escherichia coli 1-110-08_S3_C3]EYE27660.1 putative membrane protein [Escherichia coli 1-110-08_S3_C2]EYE28991.1 putative membrane protein [Escherichia coli 1-110-08_S3_C1]